MEKTDVLIVGRGAASLVAAITGKSQYPNKDLNAMIPTHAHYPLELSHQLHRSVHI